MTEDRKNPEISTFFAIESYILMTYKKVLDENGHLVHLIACKEKKHFTILKKLIKLKIR